MDKTVEKMAQLQRDARINAQETQDFMLELSSWQKEVALKDKLLKETKEVTKVGMIDGRRTFLV
jgi:hypothetical protein